MAQYEAGQYINEFMNEMPSLLLTMRKMDIDQMLDTRRLDQQDTVNNMQQQRDLVDADMRERQMFMNEKIFGEQEKKREAWTTVKKPLLDEMKLNLQREEEISQQEKDMPWHKWWRPNVEDINPFGQEDPWVKSERTLAREAAEEKYGKPREASELFGDVSKGSELLDPQQWQSIYGSDVFQPQLLGKTGLLGATTAGSMGGYYPSYPMSGQ